MALPVFDFLGMLAAARTTEKEEYKEKLKIAAFEGWQIFRLVESFSKGKKDKSRTSLLEYTDQMGLLTEKEKKHMELMKQIDAMRKRAENKRTAKEALARAANIIDLDKAARQRKGG